MENRITSKGGFSHLGMIWCKVMGKACPIGSLPARNKMTEE